MAKKNAAYTEVMVNGSHWRVARITPNEEGQLVDLDFYEGQAPVSNARQWIRDWGRDFIIDMYDPHHSDVLIEQRDATDHVAKWRKNNFAQGYKGEFF